MDEYEIVTNGHVDPKRFSGYGMQVKHLEDGTTLMAGNISDQAMLFALLGRIRDLGLKLISMKAKGV